MPTQSVGTIMMLVLYGIGLTLGNVWGGKAADRSVDRTLIVSLSALILACWPSPY